MSAANTLAKADECFCTISAVAQQVCIHAHAMGRSHHYNGGAAKGKIALFCAALYGFTRFLRDRDGTGYWLRLTPLP